MRQTEESTRVTRPSLQNPSKTSGTIVDRVPSRGVSAKLPEGHAPPSRSEAPSPSELPLTPEQQQFLRKLHFHRVHVTYLIIAINLLLFALLEWNGGSRNSNVLIEFGARFTPLIREGQYWRLLTNIFLHAGYLHILFNMYGLFNLGAVLERLYGSTRFLFLYLCSGIAGSAVSWLATESLSVGASGAVFGVAGVMVVYGFKHKHTIPREMASAFGKGALPFIALNLYLGFSHPQIDNYAHIGGLLAGMLLSALMNPAEASSALDSAPKSGFSWANLAMQAASIAVLVYGASSAVKNYWPQRQGHQAEALFREGTQRLHEGKFDQAVSEFCKAIAINSGDARFHLSLGAAHFSLGETEKAIAEYEQSLKLKPDAAETYVNLAIAWKRKGSEDKAVTAYRQAIRLKPDLLPAYFDLGTLYLNAKHDSAAVELFQALLKAKPAAESHLLIGQACLNTGRDDLALNSFRQAVDLKPDMAEARFFLGNALLRKNQRKDATESYRQALHLDANFGAARGMLSRIFAQNSMEYLKSGRWDDAQAEISELFKIDPANAEGHLLLGTVFTNKRQFADAVGEYEKFLKIAPNSPNAAKVRLEVERLRKMRG
ncbi:MAG: rhomboid family intramembrane serine protease [Acidobacteria bacterium]|nr:rhomboid family intramembrane serine protease [Acidobacteriota bacterium]MCI0723084.1 rhomboid family intramembrane serine protease [Acidobacteriota bacterium]